MALAAHEISRESKMARLAVLGVLGAALLLFPGIAQPASAGLFAQAVIFGIIGLSLNILMGYAGQISLGHTAFVGVGAFVAAFLTTENGLPMYATIPLSAVLGAVAASILGAVALRIQGLYLALITLAYGLVASRSIFGIQELTGGGAGKAALRPSLFASPKVYAYLCLVVLFLILYLDTRLIRSKFGRALIALKGNEQVASSFGVNPVFYKLAAFVLAGAIAGLAGGLLAYRQEHVVDLDFEFNIALTYAVMVVVGGIGSRIGVVIGSGFIFLVPFLLESFGRVLEKAAWLPDFIQGFGNRMPEMKIAIGALLLLLTITRFPGGIAEQLAPVINWLSFKPASHRHRPKKKRHGRHKETVEERATDSEAA